MINRHVYLALLAFSFAAPANSSPIDVYIIAGQSNAVGGAWPPYPPGDLANPQSSLYNYYLDTTQQVLESPNWEQVRSLWLSPSTKVSFGVEITFAAEMERRTGQPIAIIKVAQNGSNLHTQWRPSANDIYPIALAKIRSSLASLSDLGYEPELSGVLWLQGETDAFWDYWADLYASNLAELASALRTDLDAPNLPIALNALHASSEPVHRNILRDRQREFVESDANALLLDPSDLLLNVDRLHYTNPSFLELGYRFADLYSPPLAAADFDSNGQVGGEDLVYWKNGQGDANRDGTTDGADFLIWQQLLDLDVPPLAAADFDGNGQVGGEDLVYWKNGQGDANHDGTTDGADFLIWQQQLTAAPILMAIPEPAAGCFTLSLALFPLAIRRSVSSN